MDNADRAVEQEQIILSERIAKARGDITATAYDSAVECIGCDELIPQARREAKPGCERCIDCQQLHDSMAKEYA